MARIRKVYEEMRTETWRAYLVENENEQGRGNGGSGIGRAENEGSNQPPSVHARDFSVPPPPIRARDFSVPSGVNTPPGPPPPREGPTPAAQHSLTGTRGGSGAGANGPPGGEFRLRSSEEESYGDETWTGYTDSESGRRRPRRRTKRSSKDRKYGHQEDDMDYFRGIFLEEQAALQKLELGDDFRYPSDWAFARYFPEYDFVKAMKSNGLRKWDGTIKEYPLFRHSYHSLVFAQREHYIYKIMALEYMVPDSIKKELFHGLHNTIQDLGHRILRLEERYGGQEKQMKTLVESLQSVQGKNRIPYTELRELVGDVGAFLDRPSTLPGSGETLVVLLKKVVPKHFRTRYKEKMRDLGKLKTGNTFIQFMKYALNDEIDEAELVERDFKEKETEESGPRCSVKCTMLKETLAPVVSTIAPTMIRPTMRARFWLLR